MSRRRTDSTAPLHAAACGCGRWNTPRIPAMRITTRDPAPALISAPEARKRASISTHRTVPRVGNRKMAARVLRCLAFTCVIVLFFNTKSRGRETGDIRAGPKASLSDGAGPLLDQRVQAIDVQPTMDQQAEYASPDNGQGGDVHCISLVFKRVRSSSPGFETRARNSCARRFP